MSLSDSLSALGQQFQQALLSIYQPQVGGQTSLVFVPGGVPVSTDGGMVQPDASGQPMVNPAQLTSWLEAVADSPLQIDVADATLVGTFVALTPMSEICQSIAEFAVPCADPATPAGERVAQEISTAAAVGGPGVKPLSTVPSDWPLPGSADWNTFSSQQSTDTDPQPGNGSPGPVPVLTPPIWQVRELPVITATPGPPPDPEEAALTAAAPAALPNARLAVANAEPAAVVTEARPAPVSANAGLAPVVTDATPDIATAAQPIDEVLTGPKYLVAARAFTEAPPLRLPPPATSQTASTITMSVQHRVAVVDRSPWWQGELITDPGWYVPGLARGSYVGEPSDPVNQPYALPVAIVLARNLSISGTWSSDEVSGLVSGGVTFGPFGLGAAEVTTTSESTTVSVPGVSLIAMFCAPLPVLPPSDPPTTNATPAPAA